MKISLEDLRLLNFSRHHLLDSSKSDSILEVADSLIGLHSARLITPYASLIPRLNTFKTRDLTNVIFVERNLIKLRCMRKTLHTLTLEQAAIAHTATLDLRLSICKSFFKKHQVKQKTIRTLKEQILDCLQNKGRTSAEIEQLLKQKYKQTFPLIRMGIKQLWEEGVLCYINQSAHWQNERRIYALTSQTYSELNLNDVDKESAQKQLIYWHIQKYGPVTEKDIAWWSGLPLGIIKTTIRERSNDIERIEVKGLKGVFYISKAELALIGSLKKPSISNQVVLLAYEDPSLKGYYESRARYVEPPHYNLLFNRIGESRASVLLNGKVIGIWHWNKKQLKVELSLFEGRRLDSAHSKALKSLKEQIEVCLKAKSSKQKIFR